MVSGKVKERPYFWNLSVEESSITNRIRQALVQHKSSVQIAKVMSMQKLQRLAKMLLDNDPEQIGVKGFQFIATPLVVRVEPMYFLSSQEGKKLLADCEVQRAKILHRINSANTYNNVLQLHDVLSRNIKYVAGENPELHSIVGPLTQKVGVCEGYAKTLKFMLDAMGIPSIVIVGIGYNQLMQQEEPHAWNLVQLDGEWTHIDLTFDTTIREYNVPRYDYFGLSTEEILKDHKYDVFSYPEAKSKGLSYYERNGLVMRKKSSMNALLMESLQAGKKEIVFKLPDAVSDTNVDVQVASVINSFLSQNNLFIGYMLYYNAKQKVFHVHLED